MAGVALGVTGLVRANVLAFVPVAAIWLGWVLRHRGRSTAIRSAVFVGLGALIAVAPVTWRNYRVSDEFVPVSVNGAVSLYIGNHEGSDGTSAQIPDLEKMTGRPGWNWFRYGDIVRGYSRTEGQEMTYGDVSRAFVSRAREWIAENPGDFARLSLRRAVLFWGPSEISNNKAIRFEKENSVVLRNYPSFSVVLALSLLGLGVALVGRRGGRESAIPDGPGAFLVGSFVVVVFLTYVPFLAAARFRAPLVPLLFLFGAWALRDLIRRVTTRDYSGSAIAVAVAVALFFGVSRGGAESEVDRAWWHTDRGVALKRQDRQDEAIDEFRAALAAIPGYIDAHHGLGDLLLEREDREGALEHYLSVLRHRPDRTDLMMKASVILVDLGRFEDAERFLTNVVKIVPDSPDAHFEYGRALVELGRFEEAIVMLDRSLLLAPNQAPAAVNRGIARARLGRTQAAIDDFAQATEINPLYAEAFFHLAETLQTAGQTADAILAYEQAARVGIVYVEPRVHLGNLHNEAGRWEEAIAGYEDALRIDPNHVVAMYNIAGSLGNAGRLEDAARHLTKALEIEPANELCRQRLLQVNQLLRTRGSRAE